MSKDYIRNVIHVISFLDEVDQNKELYRSLRNPVSVIKSVDVKTISKFKHAPGYTIEDIKPAELDNALRRPMFVTLEITYLADRDALPEVPLTMRFEDLPLTIWFNSSSDRKTVKSIDDIKTAISDASSGGIMPKYLEKIKKADQVIAETSATLHAHRNLAEDYCSIKAIEVEDIAICADMDVEPSADIERILSEAFYLVDQYFSTDLKFYSLQELLDTGKAVDDIFEGPPLKNGFIDDTQLQSTNLKQVLFVSDIVNILMDIPGVRSVKNLVLLKYDKDGNVAQRMENGKLVSEIASWAMNVTYNHQPRLYIEACKILVFKNGLPFLPDRLELNDSFLVIKAAHAQPKYAETDNDLAVPQGTYYNVTDYYPVQNSLPETYGVGALGLPSTATTKRKSQAKQLKAYLMFFEQLLYNYLHQLANLSKLFSLDKTVEHTYFGGFISNELISGLDDVPGDEGIYNSFSKSKLEQLLETSTPKDPGFLDRRNRFLDHLLARFGEQFNDYALMLYSYTDDKRKTDEQLILDKIDFLQAYPFTSANRGRAMNYKDPAHVCTIDNMAGLQKRIELLLNVDDFGYLNYFEFYEEKNADGICLPKWRLVDAAGNIYLTHTENYPTLSPDDAKLQIAEVYEALTNAGRYTTVKDKKWTLSLTNKTDQVIALASQLFPTKTAAVAERDKIIAFGEQVKMTEKLFIVEHLLLRPRNKRNPVLYFELYEEKDIDGKFFERRWRLIDALRNIYLSSSTRYVDPELAKATAEAQDEIDAVCNVIQSTANYQIKKEIKWVLNLLDASGEIIATRKQHFATEAAAIAARDEIIHLVGYFGAERKPLNRDQLLATEEIPVDESIPEGDPLLPVCLNADCEGCGDEDPYSFRLTVVINGEDGPAGTDMDFRQFAEQTIRLETPAHLGIKICWVRKKDLLVFAEVYCAWRTEFAKPEPDAVELHNRLKALLESFKALKNIYPPASLHDCADGNDENRVFLGRTII